jgi:hypothetical protein
MQEGDDRKPINPRQRAIEDDEVERSGGVGLKTLGSSCCDHPRCVSRTCRLKIGGFGISLDDQNFHARL